MAKRRLRKSTATFRDILEATRVSAARTAWAKAKTASGFRHLARQQRRYRTARRWSVLKLQSVQRALTLAPEHCTVRSASDAHDLWSVRFRSAGWLHLPKWQLTGFGNA